MKAMINVRLGSSRLPGKVLKPLWNDKSALEILIERLSASTEIDEIIINTTTNPLDDKLEDFCKLNNLRYNRGSEDDVLSRMCDCVKKYNIDSFVEVFGDCPLIDPKIVTNLAKIFIDNNHDFVGNDMKTTFPPGFEVEVVKSSALLDSEKLCNDPSIREHGTLYIRQNPDLYNVVNIEYSKKVDFLPHLTLDTIEDFKVINYLHRVLSSTYGDFFDLEDLLNFVSKNPSSAQGNAHIERKWKQYRDE
jgi:spore coat polysaccharide biosynthesis protein SpsF (cytidylyltransferase family)